MSAAAREVTLGEPRSHPDLGSLGRKLEAIGGDADYRMRLAIEVDGSSDDFGIAAEVALPEAMTDYGDAAPGGTIIIGHE